MCVSVCECMHGLPVSCSEGSILGRASVCLRARAFEGAVVCGSFIVLGWDGNALGVERAPDDRGLHVKTCQRLCYNLVLN